MTEPPDSTIAALRDFNRALDALLIALDDALGVTAFLQRLTKWMHHN